MSERPDAPEGWGVRQRLPLICALTFLVALALALVVAGYFYNRDLRPETGRPYATFPAPGIEIAIHDGVNDPHRAPLPPQSDPLIAAAKREIVATGLPGWEARK